MALQRVVCFWCFFGALGWTACRSEPTQIVLVADTDLEIPSDVNRFVFELQYQNLRTMESKSETVEVDVTAGNDSGTLPVTVAVSGPRDEDATFFATVSARFDDFEVVSRQLRSNFAAGEIRILEVPLTKSCLTICCEEDQSCENGECIDTEVFAVDLPKWDGKEPDRFGSNECIPGIAEACNGLDDDCDGDVDEDFDLLNDDDNCGACRNGCPGGGRCIEGRCEGENVISVAAGEAHSCLVRESGRVSCWGRNTSGALGDETFFDKLSPSTVALIASIEEVVAGKDFSCARSSQGNVSCWGLGDVGQLGNGQRSTESSPVDVVLTGSATQLAAGAAHACARIDNGEVYCWGDNENGQVGASDAGGSAATPVRVTGEFVATQVAAGGSHSCALAEDGRVWCWGDNESGQLGSDVPGSDARAVQGIGSGGAVAVAAGPSHSCAVLSSGDVACWGSNSVDQLGDPGLGLESTLTPALAQGLVGAVSLDASSSMDSSTCAVTNENRAWCWGQNGSGQLGDGSTADRQAPVISRLDPARTVSAGSKHSCSVLMSGGVACWGDNTHGQIGTGDRAPRVIPVNLRCF